MGRVVTDVAISCLPQPIADTRGPSVAETGNGFYCEFKGASKNSVFIFRGPPSGRISLKISGDRLFVVVSGEPKGECLVECFREGLVLNLLHPGMRTLADLTGFIGSVDWKAVFTVRTLAPWDKKGNGASRIAYVVRNDMFSGLIKVASAIFFNSVHRAFDNRGDAISWLESADSASTE